MDAKAHLQNLGWRGLGYSLDQANRGLARPLLISQRSGNGGVGQKKQAEKQADQWWLNAFDSALKDLGSGKSSALEQAREHGITRGGLYGFFVKGETLGSTFSEESVKNSTGVTTPEDSVPEESASANLGSSRESESAEESTPTSTPVTSPLPFSYTLSSAASSTNGEHLKKRKRKDDNGAGNAKQHKNNSGVATGKSLVDGAVISAPEELELHSKSRRLHAKEERAFRKGGYTKKNKLVHNEARTEVATDAEHLKIKEKRKGGKQIKRAEKIELRKKTSKSHGEDGNVGEGSMIAVDLPQCIALEKALSKKAESKYRRKAAKKGITFEELIKTKEKKWAKKAAAKARASGENDDG